MFARKSALFWNEMFGFSGLLRNPPLNAYRPPNLTEIQRALGASTAVQDGDPLAVVTFHQRMARVREGVARLDDALQYAEALGNGDALTLQVAQLPQRNGDRWIGLRVAGGKPRVRESAR